MIEAYQSTGTISSPTGGSCVFESSLSINSFIRLSETNGNAAVKAMAFELATAESEIYRQDPIGVVSLFVKEADYTDKVTGKKLRAKTLVSKDFNEEPIQAWTDAGEYGFGSREEYSLFDKRARDLAGREEGEVFFVSPGKEGGQGQVHRAYLWQKIKDSDEVKVYSYTLGGKREALAKMMDLLAAGDDVSKVSLKEREYYSDKAGQISHKRIYEAYLGSLEESEKAGQAGFLSRFQDEVDFSDSEREARLKAYEDKYRVVLTRTRSELTKALESAVGAITAGAGLIAGETVMPFKMQVKAVNSTLIKEGESFKRPWGRESWDAGQKGADLHETDKRARQDREDKDKTEESFSKANSVRVEIRKGKPVRIDLLGTKKPFFAVADKGEPGKAVLPTVAAEVMPPDGNQDVIISQIRENASIERESVIFLDVSKTNGKTNSDKPDSAVRIKRISVLPEGLNTRDGETALSDLNLEGSKIAAQDTEQDKTEPFVRQVLSDNFGPWGEKIWSVFSARAKVAGDSDMYSEVLMQIEDQDEPNKHQVEGRMSVVHSAETPCGENDISLPVLFDLSKEAVLSNYQRETEERDKEQMFRSLGKKAIMIVSEFLSAGKLLFGEIADNPLLRKTGSVKSQECLKDSFFSEISNSDSLYSAERELTDFDNLLPDISGTGSGEFNTKNQEEDDSVLEFVFKIRQSAESLFSLSALGEDNPTLWFVDEYAFHPADFSFTGLIDTKSYEAGSGVLFESFNASGSVGVNLRKRPFNPSEMGVQRYGRTAVEAVCFESSDISEVFKDACVILENLREQSLRHDFSQIYAPILTCLVNLTYDSCLINKDQNDREVRQAFREFAAAVMVLLAYLENISGVYLKNNKKSKIFKRQRFLTGGKNSSGKKTKKINIIFCLTGAVGVNKFPKKAVIYRYYPIVNSLALCKN